MATKLRPNNDAITRRTVDWQLKTVTAAEGFAGEFSGYAAGIHNIDSVGDMILPGAFEKDIPRFLAEGAVCWNHDWMTPIGKPTSAKEDQYGLFVKAQISNTTAGSDIMTLIRDGVIKKMSIGYTVRDYEWVDRMGLSTYLAENVDPQKGASILQQYDEAELSQLFLLKQIKLYEFSPVTFPANNNANITGAKNLSSLDGLTFAEHSATVLAAVKDYATRAQKIRELRAKDQRTFAADRKADLQLLADELETATSSLRELLKSQGNAEASRLFAEHLRNEARALGCAV